MRKEWTRVRLGSEVLMEEYASMLKGQRIGFVTHAAAVNRELVHTLDQLIASGFRVQSLLAPEHGIDGQTQAGAVVDDGLHPRYGIRTYSLYGRTTHPTPDMLNDVDVLLIELQDIGARTYTYLYTMNDVLHVAGQRGIPVWVLDRPNPLGGAIQGGLLDSAHASFVGRHPIPLRYGHTIGELARYFNSRQEKPADVTVVPLREWQRGDGFGVGLMPFVPPSPNIPTIETALLFTGMVLFEGTNVSEGRGTTKPFATIGAPWIDGYVLADEVRAQRPAGIACRPALFEPSFSKYAGCVCGGIEVHVVDPVKACPAAFAVSLLSLIRRLWPESFVILNEDSSPFIDQLAGTSNVRAAIRTEDLQSIFSQWESENEQFERTMKPYCLYES